MSEKWVVIELVNGFEGIDQIVDVHGIFDSDRAAHHWAKSQYFSYEVKRIRKAVVDEWA